MSYRRCTLLPMAAVVALVGCNRSNLHSDRMAVCPASGEIVLDGKPAAGALLVFHPAALLQLPALPRATVGQDGRYTVGTYEADDGLPEGEYVVTVFLTVKPPGADETVKGKSLVNAKFARTQTTPLRATVARGTDGRCTIPVFKLTR